MTERDRIFAAADAPPGEFVFDARVAEVFDDMLARSIPLYQEQQAMVLQLAKRHWIPGTNVYDLGCSTATTLIGLRTALGGAARLVGYDLSAPMLEQARTKLRARGLEQCIELRRADLGANPMELRLEPASVVTMCWTLQFVEPSRRDALISAIHESLETGGALIVTEKVRANSEELDDLFVDLYHAHKRRNGYSDQEIDRKREALAGVLVPLRLDENIDLFRRNGFEIVETFFQWLNFAAFLCVKRAP